MGQPENAAGKAQEKLAKKCLFVCCGGRKRSAKLWVHLRRKLCVSFTLSPHSFSSSWFTSVSLARTEFVSEYPARKRADLCSTLQCDWWSAVSADGLMRAALLRLVEGLIHHSPVQVQCRHLRSSHNLMHMPSFYLPFLKSQTLQAVLSDLNQAVRTL